MGELRESKKRETRERISNIATDLFFERGFEAVTVDEIAAAAKVSKVTVFNYFARKEDLFIDREEDAKLLLREALADRPKEPIAALRRLVDRLSDERHPFARIDEQTAQWWRVVAASPSLQARLRVIGDEAGADLASQLGDPLSAGIVVLTWRTAYAEALRVFEKKGSARKATVAFLDVIDRGFAAAETALTSAART